MIFNSILKTTEYEKSVFGKRWLGVEEYVLLQETLIARYEKQPIDGDGQTVEVFCTAMPAKFYTLKVLPSVNSSNVNQKPYELCTGTISANLVADIAIAISEGMFTVKYEQLRKNEK